MWNETARKTPKNKDSAKERALHMETVEDFDDGPTR
jgi:hypothetical protein